MKYKYCTRYTVSVEKDKNDRKYGLERIIMKKRKFIYINMIAVLIVGAIMFKPISTYASFDLNGDGIVTDEEKNQWYSSRGVDRDKWFSDPEYRARVVSEQDAKTGETATTTPAPAPEPPKKEEKHEHKYTAKVTKEATCTEEGEMTYTCDCGDSYTEAIPKKAHEYEVTVTKEPTCTEEGMETKVCKICGDTIETPIPALGHKAGEWVTEKEPTCSEEGRSVRYCTVCGEPVETMMIDKLPHTEGKWEVVKKPTLTKPGLRAIKCTVCGEVLKEEEIPANTVLLYILIGAGVLIVGAAVSGVLIYKRKR